MSESVLQVSEMFQNSRTMKERVTETLADGNNARKRRAKGSGFKALDMIAWCHNTEESRKKIWQEKRCKLRRLPRTT